MSYGFNFDAVQSAEFFVCYDTPGGEQYWQVPVADDVQNALIDMLASTFQSLNPETGDMESFEPAQKYGAIERLTASLSEPHMEKVRNLFNAKNIDTNTNVMRETQGMAFYFAVFRDDAGRKLVAVRRATQFKGVIKARNRLISLVDDSLKLVEEDIFKLDQDFDYLIFGDRIWILRPTGFEYTAAIDEEIAACARRMTDEVATSVPCVDFTKLVDFVSKHRRAARLIASLRARADLHLTSAKKLKKGCKSNGIEIVSAKGKIYPEPGSEMAFLELLDRRRYTVELTEDEEFYLAGSRRGVSKPQPKRGD